MECSPSGLSCFLAVHLWKYNLRRCNFWQINHSSKRAYMIMGIIVSIDSSCGLPKVSQRMVSSSVMNAISCCSMETTCVGSSLTSPLSSPVRLIPSFVVLFPNRSKEEVFTTGATETLKCLVHIAVCNRIDSAHLGMSNSLKEAKIVDDL